jgi:hypothetical protein
VNTIRDGVDTRGRFPKTIEFTLLGDGERRLHEIDLAPIDSAFVGATIEFKTEGHAMIYSLEFAK